MRWIARLCGYGKWIWRGAESPVEERPGTAAIDLPEFEYVSSPELIEELMEFKTISPGIEGRLRDERDASPGS
jgi:hypothetical protein